MRLIENLTRDLKIEFDNEVPQFTFYYRGNEIESSTIESFRTKLFTFLKNTEKISNEE
jgi:hypothetical protein